MARTTITPDCGLTTTLLPSPGVISARNARAISLQKSLCETIETRLESRLVVEMALSPNAPSAGERACPAAVGAPAGIGAPDVPPVVPEIAPELTRTSLRPE